MAVINWALNLQIVDGPSLVISKSKVVEAYDKIEVTIAPGSSKQAIEIQPGSADHLNLLLIKSSVYDPKLSYLVSDGTTDSSTSITLDEPHFYLGVGAVSIFGLAPKILKFTNSLSAADPASKATIEILVGRDATP